MLTKIRRVVAGRGSDGRSTALYDGDAANSVENPDWPGFGVKLIWTTDDMPCVVRDGADEADRQFEVLPSDHGTSFLVCEFPPLSELEKMPPEKRAAAEQLAFGDTAGDTDQSLRLHKTPTLDYVIMLSGELTLLLETSETTLTAGDILIDCGVLHGWENRGNGPAICASIMIPLRDESS